VIWLLLSACVSEVEPPPPPPTPQDGLVEAEGVQWVRAHCTACHSPALVVQQGMSRERWQHTIEWMQETQNLWPIPDVQLNPLLDYLATNYGEQSADTADLPWAAPRYRPNPLWQRSE